MVSHPISMPAAAHPGGKPKPTGSSHASAVAMAQDAFISAMLELPTVYKARNPFDWVVSLAIHIVFLASLIIAPLFFIQTIDLKSFQQTFLVGPPPPAPPPPAAVAVQRVVRPVARLIRGGKMMAPAVIPKRIVILKEEALPPDVSAGGVVGGVPGGIPGGQVGGVLGGIIGGAVSSAPSMPPPPPAAKKVIRVGGNIRPPRRIDSTRLEYPIIARQAKVQGTVYIDAIIDEHGNVVEVHALSGNPLLIPAALQAVSQWKYEPTLLNNQPISVAMKVKVDFILSQ